jgi:hypothetical protein
MVSNPDLSINNISSFIALLWLNGLVGWSVVRKSWQGFTCAQYGRDLWTLADSYQRSVISDATAVRCFRPYFARYRVLANWHPSSSFTSHLISLAPSKNKPDFSSEAA